MKVMVSAPNQTTIGINNAGNLIVGRGQEAQPESSVDFGPATKRNFANIIEYLQRLSVHATDASAA